jgi:hypothetical protein
VSGAATSCRKVAAEAVLHRPDGARPAAVGNQPIHPMPGPRPLAAPYRRPVPPPPAVAAELRAAVRERRPAALLDGMVMAYPPTAARGTWRLSYRLGSTRVERSAGRTPAHVWAATLAARTDLEVAARPRSAITRPRWCRGSWRLGCPNSRLRRARVDLHHGERLCRVGRGHRGRRRLQLGRGCSCAPSSGSCKRRPRSGAGARVRRLERPGRLRVHLRYGNWFGLIYVDFETLQRIPKLSAQWFREAARQNAVV